MSMYGAYPKLKDGSEQRARPVCDCSNDEGKTVQSDRDEADINKIIARFEKAGMITSLNKSQPFYGDVSSFDGLQNAFIQVQDAEELFMGMSAQIRERFDNDPVKLIAFLADDKNRTEAESLGMVIPKPETPPAPAPAPTPTPKPAGAI